MFTPDKDTNRKAIILKRYREMIYLSDKWGNIYIHILSQKSITVSDINIWRN